mgnify:CR=1 FL=1
MLLDDPGDALFVSIKGEMSIKLSGPGGKRLASMAPGVIVGEIGNFPTDVYVAQGVAELMDVELRCVAADEVEAAIAAMGAQIGMVIGGVLLPRMEGVLQAEPKGTPRTVDARGALDGDELKNIQLFKDCF